MDVGSNQKESAILYLERNLNSLWELCQTNLSPVFKCSRKTGSQSLAHRIYTADTAGPAHIHFPTATCDSFPEGFSNHQCLGGPAGTGHSWSLCSPRSGPHPVADGSYWLNAQLSDLLVRITQRPERSTSYRPPRRVSGSCPWWQHPQPGTHCWLSAFP